MTVWFDIYLNNDFFMHLYVLNNVVSIINAYESLGYKVKIELVCLVNRLWGEKKQTIYLTKNNEPINDSAFI